MSQKYITFVGPHAHFHGRCNVPEEKNLWEIVLMLLRTERPRGDTQTIYSRSALDQAVKKEEIDQWGGILVVDCKNRLETFEKLIPAKRCLEEAWDRWESQEDLRNVCLSVCRIMENIDNEDFFFWHDSQGHKFTNVHKEKIRYALCWVVLDREPKLKAYTFRKDEGLLGLSSPMKKVQEQIDSFAPWDYPVLIQGETGTGKEVVAKAIHRLSKRAHKAFIKINCAAIPETLFENELFGHIKGAFSGSSDLKHGLFELAHEGTLFLDEIASMPSSSQTKLLRALEDKEVRRLGDEQSFTVDVRIIAATNEKLLKAVSEKRFREDLYYRLKELEIRLLPLRERLEEIPSLIQHFLNMEEHSSTLPSLTEEQLEKIKSYPWPGNIRELKSFVRRSLCLRDWDIASLEEDYQERYQIKFLPPECLNQAALAKYLGKHKSTISRMSRKRSKS